MKFNITLLFALAICFTNEMFAQLNHNMIFRVNAPASIATDYNYGAPANGNGQWGPTSISTVTGDLEWIDDNTDSLGCFPATNNLSGKVALVRRGACQFSLKAYHAQAAGAIGCVICNNDPAGGLVGMLGGDSMSAINIPVVFLTYNDCQLLHNQVDSGTTTNVSFYVPTVYDAVSTLAYNTPLRHAVALNSPSVTVYNTSTSSASNVDVSLSYKDPSGNVTTYTETIGTLPGTYDSTVVFTGGYTPSAVGTYDVVFKSTLNPLDSVTQQFTINADSVFALDNNNFVPNSGLGGIGPNDADFAAADPVTGATYFYEMGATYYVAPGTNELATSGTFALENANTYLGEQFFMLLYEQPAGGFLGTEQDYSTFTLVGASVPYIITAADTVNQHTLLTSQMYSTGGALGVTLNPDKQYMLVLRYAGTGTVTTSPQITHTHIQDYLSIAATTYVDRLYMAGWNPSYAPVIRLHVQDNNATNVVEAQTLEMDEVHIQPNPTSDFININLNLNELAESTTLNLININGKTVQTMELNNTQQEMISINAEDLPAGVYFLHVNADNAHIVKKVVIK